jgi:heme/copper-type cytochrome/quinol oxidase subunit 1
VQRGAQTGEHTHFDAMKVVLIVLVAGLMLATVGVLFAGLFGLTRKDHDPYRSNRLMRYRVLLQAGTLVLFGLLLHLLRS